MLINSRVKSTNQTLWVIPPPSLTQKRHFWHDFFLVKLIENRKKFFLQSSYFSSAFLLVKFFLNFQPPCLLDPVGSDEQLMYYYVKLYVSPFRSWKTIYIYNYCRINCIATWGPKKISKSSYPAHSYSHGSILHPFIEPY